jgi:1-phosphofructokinase
VTGTVLTVTPAGAIDLTYRVDTLELGAFVRARSAIREVSGKGVNVAAALACGGATARAILTLGSDDAPLAAGTSWLRPVLVPGQTRVSTQIVDSQGRTTKVNAPVPPISAADWGRLVDAVDAEVAAGVSWIVVGGSLPPLEDGGHPQIRDLVASAIAAGARVAVDTSGEPLRRLLADPSGITLFKPNVHELSEAVGIPLHTVGEVIEAAREVIRRGAEVMYVSMGADGALVVDAEQAVHALAVPVRLASSAGAGDASLAGFVLGAGDALDIVAGCTLAARFGAHAVAQHSSVLTGSLLTGLDGMPEAVTTIDPDPSRPLTEPADN